MQARECCAFRFRQTHKSPVTADAALSALRQVYADLEQRPIQRSCELLTGCCHFRQTGRMPLVTRVEALLSAKGVRASGRKKLVPHADGACPCLGKDGRCSIHFCAAAGGPYPRKQVQDLIQRMEALDEALGYHDGSRPFEAALADALADGPSIEKRANSAKIVRRPG
jgi:uncharacterized protein